VTIKVCTRTSSKTIDNHREIKFYEHLISLVSQHRGSAYIRDIRDTFEIDGPDGRHLCLVHSPMHMTIRDLEYLNPLRRLPEALLRCILFNILQALSFLHEEAQVIHAGKPLGIEKVCLLTK
jgi:serine/threonine protein kinase